MSDARRMTEPGHPPMKAPDEPEHWLTRPATRRKLWIGFVALLVLVAGIDLFVEHYRHFVVGGTFGFYVWFGFGSTVLLFVLAKVLGAVLRRPETYYTGAGKPHAGSRGGER